MGVGVAIRIFSQIEEEFPGTPNRYCANHFLRDLAAPMLAVDSAANVRMRHKVRGLRPIERLCLQSPSPALDEVAGLRPDHYQQAAQIVLSYCAVVRGILNDRQMILFSNHHNFFHLAGIAIQMDRHNSFRPFRYCLFYRFRTGRVVESRTFHSHFRKSL